MMDSLDIGSIFPVDTLDVTTGNNQALPFGDEPHVQYFSLCREALSVIARSLGINGKVMIPAYTCQTVITPFTELGWSCCYFGITKDLRIDIDSFKKTYTSFHPDIVIVHPYYGRDLNDEEVSVLLELKREGCVFIEDLTQCLYSSMRNSVFDYYVVSLRKWFPIPDGAALFSVKHGLEFFKTELKENSAFVEQELDAMYLRGLYYKSNDVRLKDVSRRIDKRAVGYVATDVTPHLMSKYSCTVLRDYNVKAAAERRLLNYRYLDDTLDAIGVRKLDHKEVTSAPLYFPIFVENREALIQKLIDHRIYAPVLWPVKTEGLLENESVRRIYDQILAIPCDQRYDERDLKRLVECIKK